MTTVTQFDTENRFTWHQIDSIYDPLGALDSRVTLYDNGSIMEEYFSSDLLVQKTQHDDQAGNGVYIWNRIDTYYDPLGNVSNKVTFFDDGRVREDNWQDGVRTQTSFYDNLDEPEGNGVKAWERIDINYDANGDRSSDVTFYDNGVVVENTWTNGVLSTRTQYDNPHDLDGTGAQAWERIDSTYDENGVLQSRVTFSDNGVVKDELWEGGVRTMTSLMDNPGEYENEGVKTWERIDTYYDANGQQDQKITFHDDGRVVDERWQDGVRTYTEVLDNPQDLEGGGVKAWERVETYFDGTGEVDFRNVYFDDGSVRADQWEFGHRQNSTHTDVEGTKEWTQIETYYDAFGQREARTTQYDDGRIKSQVYEGGELVTSITEDAPYSFGNGAFAWAAIGTLFENGERVANGVIYDNEDRFVREYDDGRMTRMVEIDGDGSEAWFGRITTYNLDGSTSEELHYFQFTMPDFWDMNGTQGGSDLIL